jgi:hypothetical protein
MKSVARHRGRLWKLTASLMGIAACLMPTLGWAIPCPHNPYQTHYIYSSGMITQLSQIYPASAPTSAQAQHTGDYYTNCNYGASLYAVLYFNAVAQNSGCYSIVVSNGYPKTHVYINWTPVLPYVGTHFVQFSGTLWSAPDAYTCAGYGSASVWYREAYMTRTV